MITKIDIPEDIIYLVIDGEGTCDRCGKDITHIFHFETLGDMCTECFDSARVGKSFGRAI